ncbi:hypothetical protein CHS0354_015675 [Potamilus streckersoni]|uniref:Uncharacterized protein n=1 Tax=Potamilus streckersoni TaxID=2493646 RepID=A0AAE0W1H3_9BIVA|nr:hypothetical protein CHS0354_015675 [Potamilus streckersoni]
MSVEDLIRLRVACPVRQEEVPKILSVESTRHAVQLCPHRSAETIQLEKDSTNPRGSGVFLFGIID